MVKAEFQVEEFETGLHFILWIPYMLKSHGRGAWQVTVHRVARVGCDLVTKPNHLCNILEKAKP